MNWLTLGVCGAIGGVFAVGALVYSLTTWCRAKPCFDEELAAAQTDNLPNNLK